MNAIQPDATATPDDTTTAEVIEYRSPQPLAVLTLALGLLSFLAVLRPVLWIVPLVAVVLGPISLWRLASDRTKVGRQAAIWGMALALFCGAWGVSRHLSRHWWLTSQARVDADAWLDLVQQNRLKEAHQLHGRQIQRVPEGTSIDEYYRTDKFAAHDLRAFFDQEPLRSFVALKEPVEVQFQRTAAVETDVYFDSVTLRYEVIMRREGRTYARPIHIIMRREAVEGTSDSQWFVSSVEQG